MALTVGQILVNDCLPKKFRDYTRVLDSNGLEDLLRRVATESPELYSEVTKKLMDVGNEAAFDTGVTLRLSDCETKFDKRPYFKIIDDAENAIESDPSIPEKDRGEALSEVYSKVQSSIEKGVYDTELKARNQLALQVASKARGSKGQLASFISTPGSFPTTDGRTVPMFIRHSFAEGLTPAEYWAGSYGVRLSTVSGKIATAQGGAFGKLLSQSANNQVVVTDDCGGANGVPMPLDDDDNLGAVLAHKAGKYPAGTVLTKSVLSDLRKDKKLDEIVIRSPMTCGCKSGVCAKCAGIRETGGFPPIGYNLGTNAASAFAERITQGALNCLVEGTLVRMADGSAKPIEQVNPGEYVLGSDLNGNIKPTRVVDRYDNGFQPCVRTKFIVNGTHHKSEGFYLESTTEHPILGTRVVTGQKEEKLNWVPRMLKIGMVSKNFFAYSVSTFDDTGFKHEPFAQLLGALVGDGCYTKSVNGVYFSCKDESEIHDLNEGLKDLGVSLNKLRYHNGIYYRCSKKDESNSANPVKDYLIKEGMYGKYAHDKDVPPRVWTWDNESVANFIGGFIAADGSIYPSDKNGKPGIAFASTSRILLEHIQELLLLRFGIMTSAVTKTGHTGTCYRKHDQYQITITQIEAVRKFAKVIRIPGVKNGRLSKMLEKTAHLKAHNKIAFKRISQEDIGIRHVYDLEVECDSHIYLLKSGIIVHNTKHSGRLASGEGRYSGFQMFTSLAKVPKVYPDKAILASVDGEVTEIKDAPQGGKYVVMNDGSADKEHYVAPGYKILVKPGDQLESGDQLSDGVINPAELVEYKGIGEARKYWAQRFIQGFRDSGMKGNRRNAEVLAKTLINNVELEEEDEAGLPGDVTTYTKWAYSYKPRKDTKVLRPDQARNMYLEQPILHYTIGTRVTPSVIRTLKKFGQDKVFANPNKPNVRAFMQSVVASNAVRDDWIARLGTTYLKDRLEEDVQRGAKSYLHTTEPNPGLAKGVEFGTWGQAGSKNKTPEFTY